MGNLNIKAVAAYRAKHGCGLREAYDAVNAGLHLVEEPEGVTDAANEQDAIIRRQVAALTAAVARAEEYYERWNDCQEKRMTAEARAEALEAEVERLRGALADATAWIDERSKRWTTYAADAVGTVQKLEAKIAAFAARAEAADALSNAAQKLATNLSVNGANVGGMRVDLFRALEAYAALRGDANG